MTVAGDRGIIKYWAILRQESWLRAGGILKTTRRQWSPDQVRGQPIETMSKRFTLAEAERLLTRVEPLLRSAIDLKGDLDRAQGELAEYRERVALMGGVTLDRERVVAVRTRSDAAASHLRTAIEQVQGLGCVIKDLETGLIDFPTLLRGDEVYLCWRLGEPGIAFWHGVDEGFRGRKPVDRDFLDNHSGD